MVGSELDPDLRCHHAVLPLDFRNAYSTGPGTGTVPTVKATDKLFRTFRGNLG
jgi:hypothetical protein